MVGVESIAAGAVTVRIVAKCAPGENFPLQREIRERVKVALDRGGCAPRAAAAVRRRCAPRMRQPFAGPRRS